MSEQQTTTLFPDIDEEDEQFESNYAFYLSQSELMKTYEIQFKQTLHINPDEQKNPNIINQYLNKIDKSF